MTALDPALCARLISEAREDDASLPTEPWRNTFSPLRADVVATLSNGEVVVVARCNLTDDDATDREHSIAGRIARTRNNLRALADQLEAALAEVAHMHLERGIAATDRLTENRHRQEGDPTYEYATTKGPRKAWDPVPPDGAGWFPNAHRGVNGWERFDYHEEAYWMRLRRLAGG